MRLSATITLRASAIIVCATLAAACTSSDSTGTPQETATTAAPTTTAAATSAPTTTAPTTTASPTTEPELDAEQIAWDALEGYGSMFGDSNPDYSLENVEELTMGLLTESVTGLFTERAANGFTASGAFEILDVMVTLEEAGRIEVRFCALDAITVYDASGDVALQPDTAPVLGGAVIEMEDGVWKPSSLGVKDGVRQECVDAS